MVERKPYDLLFGQRKAPDGTSLGRRPDGGRKAADLYARLLAAEPEVDEMIWQAVRAGFGYFQREAGYPRTGSHGARVHGREAGQWHEADLAVAHWLQPR